MELGKIPPQDIDAEQAILGSMLTDKDAVILAIEKLKAEDFYRDDNKIIYEAILNLYNKAEPIDIITVKAELVSAQKFDLIGGLEYLALLPDKVPTTANIEKYVKIVEEKSILRNMIKTSNEIIDLGYNQTEEIDSIMELAEKKIFNMMKNRNQKGYTHIKDVLIETFAEIERLHNNKGNVSGIPTGFIDLDKKISGLHNSDLIIIAARPGMGKSALAVNIATNVAINSNTPVVLFNLEMSKEQIAKRILASEAMVNSSKLQNGDIEEEDWMKIATAVGNISEAPIIIDDTPGISITEIRAKCRKLQLEKHIGLIVIDYLQLIQASGKKSYSREQEMSEVSRSLKVLAKELNVPVIALSQLSRDAEKRTDHRPMLSDLRETGAIEQDADMVIFIYREDYYDKESAKQNVAEIILAKHRAGSCGTVELLWLGEHTKFVNKGRDIE